MKKGIYAILALLLIAALAMMGCPTDGGDTDDAFTVTFDKNGGTSEADPKTASTTTSGGTVTLPTTNPGAPAGKQFAGWNTKSDGSGTEFTATTPVTESITVYAKWVEFNPQPALQDLTDASYELNTTENVNLRIAVTNATQIEADGGTLSYVWYKAADTTSAGTVITGATTRDCTPDVATQGTTYYWVVVTNSKGSLSTTSSKAKIIIYTPSTDSAIEKIVSNNSAVPLWEFTLPSGASWADYEKFSIAYYVSKDSRIVEHTVRSRLYGAYIPDDFAPDQGDGNGWAGFVMINWNGTKVSRPDVTGLNPNNDFIIDNSRGTAAELGALFTAEGGGTSKWFTVEYSTDGSASTLAKDYTKVTLVDSATVPAIYVGAGIFQNGGNAGVDYEFYVKNPTLVHKSDPTLNIRGVINRTDITGKLFAGNLGSQKGGTDRTVVTGDYQDVEGEIMISFALDGGTGDFPPARIMTGETLGAKFPSATPTRDGYTFLGWFYTVNEAETQATATTVFEVKTTLTAKWQLDAVVTTYVVDLTGLTVKNQTAWTSAYNNGLLFPVGTDFNVNFYDQVEIVCKFYAADGTTEVTEVPASNFQLKWHSVQVDNANGVNNGTQYNFGQDAPVNEGSEGGLKVTYTVPTAVKTNGLWGIGIQTSGGTEGVFAAQFVEVLSITFPAPAAE